MPGDKPLNTVPAWRVRKPDVHRPRTKTRVEMPLQQARRCQWRLRKGLLTHRVRLTCGRCRDSRIPWHSLAPWKTLLIKWLPSALEKDQLCS